MLSPVETIALSKCVKEKAAKDARPKLAEGPHVVDVTVRVTGHLLVAPPTATTVKESVPFETLLAIVLADLTPAARRKVRGSFVRLLAAWRDGADELPTAPAEAAEELLALARREREGTRNGNVTAPLTVELIGRAVPA